MYTVSENYKTQIKNDVRNPSYLKIKFSFIDPQAKGDSSLSDNGHIFYSNTTNVKDSMNVPTNYATFEYDRFLLDGKQTLLPSSDYSYQGFIGDKMSNSNGIFETQSVMTINFLTSYFTFMGLGFNFDTFVNEYPKQLQIKAYKDNVLVYDAIKNPDRATEYYWKEDIPQCNKIEVIGLESTSKYRRFRIEDLIFGVKEIFEDDKIVNATWKRDVDLISSKIPSISFNFTILDKLREYDPENATGLYAYLEEEQPCEFIFGYELDDESIEWQQGGNMFSKGEVEVKSDVIIPTVSFKTVSVINYLTKKYKQGIYTGTNVSLYDLAESLLQYSDLPLDNNGNNRWSLDTSLQSLYTLMPLPNGEIRALLQLIANAGMCTLDVDRNGYVTIKPMKISIEDFSYTLGDIMNPPITKKYPQLQGVDTYLNTITIDATATELAKFDINGASNTVYEFEYDMASEISAVAGTGLTIIGTPEYYATMCRITLNGSGTLIINGKLLTISKTNVNSEFNVSGERCPIENSLITNANHAKNYATWIGNYINRRNEYTIEDRGFTEIDTGDNVKLNTLFTDNVNVTVISSEIDYNGTIKGKTKLLIQ